MQGRKRLCWDNVKKGVKCLSAEGAGFKAPGTTRPMNETR